MRIFEPHIHMVSRVTEDYEVMAAAGVELILEPAFWLGEPRKRLGTFLDYFDSLLGFEVTRARNYNIEHVCTIAINPREANNRALAEEVFPHLDAYLKNDRCVGVGEIGYDDITEAEEEFLRRQLDLARVHGLPALVHTPHRRKAYGTARTIDVCREVGFPIDRLLLDHATEETVKMILDSGAWCGFTIYPNTKLTPERATNMLLEYGVDRMMINSSADWGPSTTMSVPYTCVEMRRRGIDAATISRLVWDNPFAFYNVTGRLSKLKAW